MLLLIPVIVALVKGITDAKSYIAELPNKRNATGVILVSAFVIAAIVAVGPYWRGASTEVYPPSIWEEILLHGTVILFVASWLIRKFADDYAVPTLRLLSIGVILAIPAAFLLYICLNDFLIGYYRITLTN